MYRPNGKKTFPLAAEAENGHDDARGEAPEYHTCRIVDDLFGHAARQVPDT